MKTKTKMAKGVMEHLKKAESKKNWKETAKNRRNWRDLAEKAETYKRVVVPTGDNNDSRYALFSSFFTYSR